MRQFLLLLLLAILPGAVVTAQFTISAQQPLCYNSCNGTAHINAPTGHYRYLWSTGDTVAAISNLCAGPYQCTVSDSTGLALDTLGSTISQPALLVIAPQTIKNHTCYNDTTGYVVFSATGGTGSRYSFSWSTGFQGFLRNGDQFFEPAGNYTVTISDTHACSATTNFAITQPNAINLSPLITSTSVCNACDGIISPTVMGNPSNTYSYSWSTGSTTRMISNLCTGGYNLSVTDTSGCLTTWHFNVLPAQSSLVVSFSTVTNIDCVHPTGTLFASPSGGRTPYHYSWSTGSTSPDIFNLTTGIYQVSVTDSVGCLSVATDTIINSGIAISTLLQQNFRCDVNTGKIIIAVSQGTPPYNLNWNNQANTDTLSGLRPGNYSLTVTDQSGCSATGSYNIAQNNTTLSAQIAGTNVTCANINNGSAIANIIGGVAPFNLLWNSSPFQTADTATGLPVGNYRLRVIDGFGCTIFAYTTILDNYSGLVSTSTSVGNCDSTGSATASVAVGVPPYTYLWNTQPSQATSTATNIGVGNYSVSVTDSLGCTRTGSANLQYSCTGLVTGTVFYDANANCIIDNGEQGIAGVPVYVTNHSMTFEGLTNISGQYSIPVTQAGGYKIVSGVSASSAILQYGNSACGYLEPCPATDTITFITLRDTFQHYNFGFVGSSDFDLAINAGWAPVDANHLKEYWILYANQAFITPDTNPATITFNYDPNLTFQSGIPTPVNNIATHTLTWTVDSFPSPTFIWPKRVRAFFSVPGNLPVDYQLKNDFHIQPYAGDCDTANNSIYTEEIAGLPTAPVSKEVIPIGNLSVEDSVLTYTIHFQNNGSDSATVVKVTDSLSPYLDPSSIVNICSYPLYNQFYIAPGVVLTWIFNPATLPDSAVNPQGSAGFISFTAKLKHGTGSGYFVKNQASVSINNNAPTFTNTTSNFIAFPVAVSDLPENLVRVRVFPNPFNQLTNVEVTGVTDKYDFELIDITGRVVCRLSSVATNHFQINREGLLTGVYIYRVYTENQPVAYGKLVVE